MLAAPAISAANAPVPTPSVRTRPTAGAAQRKAATLPTGFLERLSVWPTCTFKSDGSVVESNSALNALLRHVSGGRDLWADTAYKGQANLFDLTFHPEGLIQWMVNPEAVIPETLRRLRIEASRNANLASALSRFEAYPCVQEMGAGLSDPPPLLEEISRMPGDKTLRMISVLSSIASPGEYDLASLRIETFVPADEASVQILSSLALPATLRAT